MEYLIASQILDNKLLETIISLVLVYAFLSILTSLIVEVLNTYTQERGTALRETITRMLEDPVNLNFGHMMYQHPLIDKMRRNVDRLPQYISAESFADALMDVVGQHGVVRSFSESETGVTVLTKTEKFEPFAQFQTGLKALNESGIKTLLTGFLSRSADIKELRQNLIQWYNDTQDRATGWYVRRIRYRVWIASAIVTIVLNVDSLRLFRVLYDNDTLRAKTVAIAEKAADQYKAQDSTLRVEDRIAEALLRSVDSTMLNNQDKSVNDKIMMADSIQKYIKLLKVGQLVKLDSINTVRIQKADSTLTVLESLNLPIGWQKSLPPITLEDSEIPKPCSFLYWLAGLFITWFSLLFGAPFWFDAMLKLINIRTAGKKPGTTTKSN